jgi:hypothetical protein
MRGFSFTPGKLLAVVAVVIFAIVSVGEFPEALADDFEPVALGLAFLAAAYVMS